MRNLSLLVISVLCFSLYAFAQSSPVVAPAASAVVSAALPAPAVGVPVVPSTGLPLSAGLIGLLAALVLGLNSILSAVQKVFASLSQSEPGWLKTVSSIVLAVAKFLGSNPSV